MPTSEVPIVTGPDILDGLRHVGLAPGDTVFAHSSLSAFGHVEGGADTVIDALIETVGDEGTVVLPTFTWGKFHGAPEPVTLDLAHEPVKGEVGIIPETFRQRPGVVRSTHICHSVAAIGPQAEAAMGDGVKSFGKGSAFDRLEELNAWYLFLGTSMQSCTALHHVEDLMQVPYRYYRDFKGSTVVLPDGTRQPCHSVEFLRKPGFRNDFLKMEPLFIEHGVLRTTTIGAATVMNLRIRDLVRVAVRYLDDDIEFLLSVQEEPSV